MYNKIQLNLYVFFSISQNSRQVSETRTRREYFQKKDFKMVVRKTTTKAVFDKRYERTSLYKCIFVPLQWTHWWYQKAWQKTRHKHSHGSELVQVTCTATFHNHARFQPRRNPATSLSGLWLSSNYFPSISNDLLEAWNCWSQPVHPLDKFDSTVVCCSYV